MREFERVFDAAELQQRERAAFGEIDDCLSAFAGGPSLASENQCSALSIVGAVVFEPAGEREIGGALAARDLGEELGERLGRDRFVALALIDERRCARV